MNYRYGDLVEVTSKYFPMADKGDTATVMHVDKYGNITILLEDGEFAGRMEEVSDEHIKLIDRLADEDLDLLKEEL